MLPTLQNTFSNMSTTSITSSVSSDDEKQLQDTQQNHPELKQSDSNVYTSKLTGPGAECMGNHLFLEVLVSYLDVETGFYLGLQCDSSNVRQQWLVFGYVIKLDRNKKLANQKNEKYLSFKLMSDKQVDNLKINNVDFPKLKLPLFKQIKDVQFDDELLNSNWNQNITARKQDSNKYSDYEKELRFCMFSNLMFPKFWMDYVQNWLQHVTNGNTIKEMIALKVMRYILRKEIHVDMECIEFYSVDQTVCFTENESDTYVEKWEHIAWLIINRQQDNDTQELQNINRGDIWRVKKSHIFELRCQQTNIHTLSPKKAVDIKKLL